MSTSEGPFRVLIATTNGPVEVLSLRPQAPAVRRSVVSIRGTTERAAIERAYHQFVASETGLVNNIFGKGTFRLDISDRIDAGESWQLGLLVAHALLASGRLSDPKSARSGTVWATGTVARATELGVGQVGDVPHKIQLSLNDFRKEVAHGRRVIVALPLANEHVIAPTLRRELSDAGVELLVVDQVNQVLKTLGLPLIRVAQSSVRWQGSPYRGLEAFDTVHRAVFAGRGSAREEVLGRLRQAASRGSAFLLIHGRSGTGKSSLVKAGLIPDIRAQSDGTQAWHHYVTIPARTGAGPVASMAQALVDAVPELVRIGWSVDTLTASLFHDSASAIAGIQTALPVGLPDTRLLLVIDQLEQLFAWHHEDGARVALERSAYADAIAGLSTSGRVWIVATLRSDMLSLIDDLPALSRLAHSDQLYRLERPTRSELREIVVRPAETANLRFSEEDETGLPFAEVLIEAASAAPDSLPLLQLVLSRLYEAEGSSGQLTFSAYKTMGRLAGVIDQHANKVVASLTPGPETEQAVDELILRLGRIDIEHGTVVARATQIEGYDSPELRDAAEAFTAARLILPDEHGVLRVTHEAVLSHWPRAKLLFDRHARKIAVRDELDRDAVRWLRRPTDEHLIPEGTRLAEALDLQTTGSITLSVDTRRFIEASDALAQRLRQEREKDASRQKLIRARMKGALIGAAVLGCLFLGSVMLGWKWLEQATGLCTASNMYTFANGRFERVKGEWIEFQRERRYAVFKERLENREFIYLADNRAACTEKEGRAMIVRVPKCGGEVTWTCENPLDWRTYNHPFQLATRVDTFWDRLGPLKYLKRLVD